MAGPAAGSAQPRDYYEVLGVARDAEPDSIKRAYRKLALKFHPDRAGDDPQAEDSFKEASEAYEVLSNPDKRSSYDRFGHDGLRGSGFSGFSGVGIGDILEHFSDIFGDAIGFGFGGQRPGGRGVGNRPARGSDIQIEVGLEFREAILGTKKPVDLVHPTQCTTCQGNGARPGSTPETCRSCGGSGRTQHQQGFLVIATTCSGCAGEGRVITDPCDECRGAGHVQEQRTVSVTIPAGVDNGIRLRLADEGQPGRNGGPPGDLYVFLDVASDPVFTRDGSDVHCEVEIPFFVAALGGQVQVPTAHDDELESLRIRPGTQPGETVRLKGKGAPSLRRSTHGDQICHVRVNIPKRLDDEQRSLLEELARVSGWDEITVKADKPGFFERLFRED